MTLYCIWQTQRVNRKKSDVNRHYLLWECTRIFFWCTFSTKGLIVIKGFYCLYKKQSICGFCFITVAWWWVHCGCCHMKSALEWETCYENIKAVLCHFIFPIKSIPKYVQPVELEYSTYVLGWGGGSPFLSSGPIFNKLSKLKVLCIKWRIIHTSMIRWIHSTVTLPHCSFFVFKCYVSLNSVSSSN